ncbi:hypothetical protein FVF66_18075 [Pseudomonas aeruginosa PA99]|nr:hypothetical protein FVF66_18075 [Pseudomonas aeruginosa PA99]
MDGAPTLQVPERFPVAPAPKQSALASSVADNRVRPCTHVKSLKGGWEVVELTLPLSDGREITTKAIYRQHLGSLQKIHRSVDCRAWTRAPRSRPTASPLASSRPWRCAT